MTFVDQIIYEDLIVELDRRQTGAHHLQLRGTNCGEASTSVNLSAVLERLAPVLTELPSSIASGRLPTGVPDKLCGLGAELFDTVFSGPVRDAYLSSRGRIESRGHGLRIQLSARPKATDVLSVPWELLHQSKHREFLARCPVQSIVRRVAVPQLKPLPSASADIRVLIISASPSGLPNLQSLKETQPLRHLLEAHGAYVKVLPHATIDSLDQALRQSFNIVHFIGHGHFDARTESGCIVLEDLRGRAVEVAGSLFAEVLTYRPGLNLVLLSSCDSARVPRVEGRDPFTSMAPALILAGLPAVLAMQFPISNAAARVFGHVLYESLVEHKSLDLAVTTGRRALYQTYPNTWEWITPTLFLGASHELFTHTLDDSNARRPTQKEATTLSKGQNVGDILGSGVFVGNNHTFGDVSIGQTRTLDDEGRERYRHGLRQLKRQNYAVAASVLEEAWRTTDSEPDAGFWLTLARLGGRRPRLLSLAEIRALEEVLRATVQDDSPPHGILLWALIKQDYYLGNGVKDSLPSIHHLVQRLPSRLAPSKELQELRDHLAPLTGPLYSRLLRVTQDPE